MNTKIYQEEQLLRKELENLAKFSITDTALLDLIQERKLSFQPSTTNPSLWIATSLYQVVIADSARSAALKLLIKLYQA